jgi:hypothetical protein
LILAGIHRIQTAEGDRKIGRECHLQKKLLALFVQAGTTAHTAYFYWCLELQKYWLLQEDFACLCAEILDFVLQQVDLLSGTISSN